MSLSVDRARVEAVFVSGLQASDKPTAADVETAVAKTVRAYRSRGCAARVAQEYGDHPDTAPARMRWARDLVEQVYPGRCPYTPARIAWIRAEVAAAKRAAADEPPAPKLTAAQVVAEFERRRRP